MAEQQQKAVFFDRDGVVNTRIMGGYVTGIEQFTILPGFVDIFRRVKEAGYLAVLITNQQGIGKGLMTEADLHAIHDYMQSELAAHTGFVFDDIFFCPELASVKNSCRKPSPAMLLAAMDKWNIDPVRSWMIGDTISDAKAARAAGVRAILVGDFVGQANIPADYVVSSLEEVLLHCPILPKMPTF